MTLREVREIARTLDFHVPELEEVLALTRGKIGLDIELKEEGYEREIIRLVGRSLAEGDFIVSSFHAGCLARVKQCRAGVRTGLIFKDAGALTTAILEGDTDWLLPARNLAEGELLERMSRSGKKIAVWTVNDTKQMRRLLEDDRIEGIITDRTDAALAVRAGREAPNG